MKKPRGRPRVDQRRSTCACLPRTCVYSTPGSPASPTRSLHGLRLSDACSGGRSAATSRDEPMAPPALSLDGRAWCERRGRRNLVL